MNHQDVVGTVREGRAAARLGNARTSNPYAGVDGYASLAQAWYSGFDGESNKARAWDTPGPGGVTPRLTSQWRANGCDTY